VSVIGDPANCTLGDIVNGYYSELNRWKHGGNLLR
jgi:hypothetical protein